MFVAKYAKPKKSDCLSKMYEDGSRWSKLGIYKSFSPEVSLEDFPAFRSLEKLRDGFKNAPSKMLELQKMLL